MSSTEPPLSALGRQSPTANVTVPAKYSTSIPDRAGSERQRAGRGADSLDIGPPPCAHTHIWCMWCVGSHGNDKEPTRTAGLVRKTRPPELHYDSTLLARSYLSSQSYGNEVKRHFAHGAGRGKGVSGLKSSHWIVIMKYAMQRAKRRQRLLLEIAAGRHFKVSACGLTIGHRSSWLQRATHSACRLWVLEEPRNGQAAPINKGQRTLLQHLQPPSTWGPGPEGWRGEMEWEFRMVHHLRIDPAGPEMGAGRSRRPSSVREILGFLQAEIALVLPTLHWHLDSPCTYLHWRRECVGTCT
ncbi:hypothetical protein B0H67DRAFT_160818 [Lasiosphaeris hirsuta]|uniref:Uncharacterized protein n=1 Tax=Lasiosphaeris hirsuta TaxID=260670 RepID=A0AA40APM7_9PEZI|nr:hypothetical protein B0H67DRAFT_160818 [Lasiosphaeris hirsuta]